MVFYCLLLSYCGRPKLSISSILDSDEIHSPINHRPLRVLAEELGLKYDIFDALQSDNARLRGTLTGKPSDVDTLDD